MKGLVKLVGAALFLMAMAASASTESEADSIKTLLNRFLEGAAVNDIKMHDRFWADDLVYTSSSGKRFGKAALMASLESAPTDSEEKTTYSAEDLNIRLFEDVAVITFKLVGETDNERHYYLNSGTLVKNDNEWRVVNWQATHMQQE